MKFSIQPKLTSPLRTWELKFSELGLAWAFQLFMLTPCLWMMISYHVVCLPGISDPGEALNFLQPIVWVVLCGSGVAAVLIHILFARILRKGVRENRKGYVAVWLMYVLTSWTDLIIHMLDKSNSIALNVGLAVVIGLILLPVLCSLRSILQRRERELTLSSTSPKSCRWWPRSRSTQNSSITI